jgi:hypothetical protein
VVLLALGRVYTVDSGLITLAATTQTLMLAATAPSTATCDIQAIRIGLASGSGVSYPANGTVACGLYRNTGARTAGLALTPSPHNTGDVAAQTSWWSGSTAITGFTIGTALLWNIVLPFTAGANWGEWVTPGAEWRIPISASAGIWLTCSSAGTATQFQIEAVFSE